jgi:hypothetical protein
MATTCVDPRLRRSNTQHRAIKDTLLEMVRQDEKWGPQTHQDGTGRGYGADMLVDLDRHGADAASSIADVARARCEFHTKQGTLTWEDILTEEFFEALEESDSDRLRTELIQVAAVALNWAVDIDTRTEQSSND